MKGQKFTTLLERALLEQEMTRLTVGGEPELVFVVTPDVYRALQIYGAPSRELLFTFDDRLRAGRAILNHSRIYVVQEKTCGSLFAVAVCGDAGFYLWRGAPRPLLLVLDDCLYHTVDVSGRVRLSDTALTVCQFFSDEHYLNAAEMERQSGYPDWPAFTTKDFSQFLKDCVPAPVLAPAT